MSKEESKILKGIFILLMLFVHVFSFNTQAIDFQLNINNIPLILILKRAANPVPFFLLAGGYGLFIVSQRFDKKHISRIIKLFVSYWIITSFFIVLASYIQPDKFNYNISNIFLNYSGLKTTYNHPMWFLLPYTLLSLSYPLIFKFLKKYNSYIIATLLFLFNIGTSLIISRFGYYENHVLNTLFLSLHLLFPLSFGTLIAKENLVVKLKTIFNNQIRKWYWNWLLLSLLFTDIIIRCIFDTSILNTFYAAIFILIILLMKRNIHVNKTLLFFGKHSMNIWMIHAYIYI